MRLYNTLVGFDRILNLLDTLDASVSRETYPPHNIIKDSEYNYRIEMAVAGFDKNDLEVTLSNNRLSIAGNKSETSDSKYIHRGLASRSFIKHLDLVETIQVKTVDLTNGILTIYLENVIPEAQKPKTFEITTGPPTPKKLVSAA